MGRQIENAPGDRQSGMTLVEVAISGALLVGVLLVAASTTQTMNQMIRASEAESTTVDRVRDILHQLKQDLAATSLTPDPVTGVGRVQIETAPNGGQRLRVRRIDGAALAAGSLAMEWSPWITWEMDAAGAVWRTLDGEEPRLVARGMASMAFTNHGNRCVSMVIRSGDRAANGHAIKAIELGDIVQPTN